MKQVVYLGSQVQLEKIVSPGNMADAVFDPVMWAYDNNRVAVLAHAEIQGNPARVALRWCADYLCGKWPAAP